MTDSASEVDMSAAAIEARIRTVVSLNRLCASLAEAGRAIRQQDRKSRERGQK